MDAALDLFRTDVISILIPVFNERSYIRRCVEHIINVPLLYNIQKEIIIVDDGSTDGTSEVVREIAALYPVLVRAIILEKNNGKGAALRNAIQHITGEYVIFQDADLEYDPNDYNIIIQAFKTGHADVVYGSRFANRSMRRVFNYHHALGNKFLTHLSNLTTGLDLTDMGTGYKAFRSDILKTIPLRSNRFGIEAEITAKIAKRNCIVFEVPISYTGRSYLEGKKVSWKDGFSAIYSIFKYWLLDDCFDQHYGKAILNNLSYARRFNKWIVDYFQPFFGERILEIGSGIGNISRILPKKERLIVTDIDPTYLRFLQIAFKDNDIVDVVRLDVTCQKDCEKIGGSVCDTIVCVNVLEHIENDEIALRNMCHMLSPGGRLILLIPQYKWLFGSYDQHVGHVRRYTRKVLAKKLKEANFQVVKFKNFNFMGIVGWWVNSCLLKRKSMDRWQLKIFDTMVPVTRIIEKMFPLPGISLICIAESIS